MKEKLITVVASLAVLSTMGIAITIGMVTHRHDTAVAAPKPMPAGGISLSPAVNADIAAQEALNSDVAQELKNLQQLKAIRDWTQKNDELTGATNRVQVEIANEMKRLNLSPNVFQFQQDCRCFVPKPAPAPAAAKAPDPVPSPSPAPLASQPAGAKKK